MTASPIVLSAEKVAFIQGNVTMYAATTGNNSRPHIARLAGARIDTPSNAVTVFMGASGAGGLLADIRAGRALAVVFCEPGSEKAIQLKSNCVEIVKLRRDDQHLIANYCERLIKHITPLGFSQDMLRSFFAPPISDVVAVQFTPCAAFDQTPGPNAGIALTN